MTFSILGRDSVTGELGSAVASRSVAVGGTVIYSRYGVGIVNTQHYSHLAMGLRVLDEMERGRAPQAALDTVLAGAPKSQHRQLIATDLGSDPGAWTGNRCAAAHRHVITASCVAAGNMLARTTVIDRMVEAFESAGDEPLGARLITSLEAGESAGGDRRGRQAAAVRVLPPPDRAAAINLDLRVDDHADPLRELRRLHDAFRREFGS